MGQFAASASLDGITHAVLVKDFNHREAAQTCTRGFYRSAGGHTVELCMDMR